ncbi:TPA: hypothetical protein ACPZ0W_004215 [Enterobacter bugandensis]|uniref:hypothetical protein n=1 Tax=Enterobacter bugandensis TaxID=881260 RepID=UPI0005EC499D|nr:hypothetical protein [Enterobacter bugandensis]KJN35152.1 hypothetical protein SS14_04600 [Enterobacter bugandensis]
MTLLELLVEMLPKHGGWPAGAVECVRFVDEATIDFYDEHGNWPDDCSLTYGSIAKEICRKPTEPCQRESVTLTEYEAALAASKPEWDGLGLPPVGCEFLFGTHQTKAKCIAVGRDVIFASIGNPDEEDGVYEEFVISIHHSEFRPIRSEAEKKRAEGVIALSRVDPQAMPFEYGDKHSDGSLVGPFWYELYDAIAAGKIPHIRID